MLRTRLCDLLGIDYPIIQAGMGPFTSAELAAAVSNAGGLGSLGAGARAVDDFAHHLARLHALTERPFAVNHTIPTLSEEAFALTVDLRPALISFALGDPSPWVKRAHEAGILVMHQVTTVRQARQAAASGVDVINAQGGEAGGFGGFVSTLALAPQVVDAVSPLPVVASGGIADGRGLAAALVLGADGVNVGTRFLASVEAPIDVAWKQAILAAQSEDALKVEVWADIFPPHGDDYLAIPRALGSPFIEQWKDRRDTAGREADRLRTEIGMAIAEGKFGELFPFAGQSAGLLREVLPAAEIVRRLVAEAEDALASRARDIR